MIQTKGDTVDSIFVSYDQVEAILWREKMFKSDWPVIKYYTLKSNYWNWINKEIP